ncbi:MAG: hypothetical protein Q9164_000580 [Protoblastenia rupestris]
MLHASTPFLALLSLLLFTTTPTFTSPIPAPSTDNDDIVSNSLSPVSNNAAGDSNTNIGTLNGNSIGRREPHPQNTNTDTDNDNIISNSLSPLSNNAAGDGNECIGDVTCNTVSPDVNLSPNVEPNVSPSVSVLGRRKAQGEGDDADDVVSNSLSPGSNNAAGDGNGCIGYLSCNMLGPEVDVSPSVEPNVSPSVSVLGGGVVE